MHLEDRLTLPQQKRLSLLCVLRARKKMTCFAQVRIIVESVLPPVCLRLLSLSCRCSHTRQRFCLKRDLAHEAACTAAGRACEQQALPGQVTLKPKPCPNTRQHAPRQGTLVNDMRYLASVVTQCFT